MQIQHCFAQCKLLYRTLTTASILPCTLPQSPQEAGTLPDAAAVACVFIYLSNT